MVKKTAIKKERVQTKKIGTPLKTKRPILKKNGQVPARIKIWILKQK
jgi:hypothetical protein